MLCDGEKYVLELNKDGQEKRVFDYTLNHKRAKTKLLKGAKKDNNLDVEIKPGCVNLRFDDGSYYELILPLLQAWSQQVNQVVKIGGTEVKIIEVSAGKENNGNHVDTKLVVMHENDRLVFHAYNGTQNLMIQGKHYENFALHVLEPFFSKHIQEALDKIRNFNSKVIEHLGPKKSLKINANKPYNCPQCNILTKTNGDLKIHLKTCHSKPSINSPKRNKMLKVLEEDTSIIVDDNIVEVDTMLAITNTNDQESPHFLPLVEDFINCNICEFDSLLQEELDAHMAEIHGHKEPLKDSKETDNYKFQCFHCEFTSKDQKEVDLHAHSIHEDPKFKCKDCGFVSNDEEGLKKHTELTHDKAPPINSTNCELNPINMEDITPHRPSHVDVMQFNCKKCAFTTNNEEKKLQHIQSSHMNMQVDLNLADQNVIKCEHCEYRCRYRIQIKKHVEKKHITEHKYKCKQCDFYSDYVADTWEHTLEVHPDESVKESDKENLVLKIVAEQTNALMGEVASIKKDNRDVFKEIADIFSLAIDKIKRDNDIKCKTIGNTVAKIYDKVSKIEKALEISKQQPLIKPAKDSKKKTYADVVHKESNNSPIKEDTKSCSSKPSQPTILSPPPVRSEPALRPPARNTTFLRQEKLLFVGDSVGHTGGLRSIERSRKCRIKSARAYSSKPDNNARWPEYNFEDIVKNNLKKPGREEFDVLVMSAPTVDITNLNTTKVATNNTEDLELKAIESSRNMFNIAETSLKENKNLKKVIIMDHPPRFDDPLRSELAELANSTLSQLWAVSPLKDRVIVGRHNLGSWGMDMNRFKDINTGKYDGVHLFGPSGRKDYTDSINNILFLAKVGNTSVLNFGHNDTAHQPDDHSNCEQARYQWMQAQKRRLSRQSRYNTDYQRSFNPIAHGAVPVQNRFSIFNQGN